MPSASSVHVDALLTDVAVARPMGQFIADEVYPVKFVAKQSDKILEVDPTDDAHRVEDDVLGDTSPVRYVDFDVSTSDTYFSERHGLGGKVSFAERDNADSPIIPFQDRTWFLKNKLLVAKEVALVTKLGTDITNTSTPTAKFDDYTAGDPFDFLKSKINAAEVASGVRPNCLAMDRLVLEAIMNHPDIQDRFRYTLGGVFQGGIAEAAKLLAKILMIDDVKTSEANFKNTALEGATTSRSRVWSDNILIFRKEPISIGTMATGAQFVWRGGLTGMGQGGIEVLRYRENDGALYENVDMNMYYDLKTLSAETAHWITNALDEI